MTDLQAPITQADYEALTKPSQPFPWPYRYDVGTHEDDRILSVSKPDMSLVWREQYIASSLSESQLRQRVIYREQI